MGFPTDIAEKVLVDCGRCCVICHKFCGSKMELHHIKQVADGGENTYDNCIPLCFDCHADVKSYNSKHPKGRKYTESELISHRNKWYEKAQTSIGAVPINSEKVTSDIVVLDEIKSILSIENVPFLFHYNYHVEFEGKTYESLNNYTDKCYEPNFEFYDVDMEVHKTNLFTSINELVDLMIRYTTCVDGKFKINDNIIESEQIHYATLAVKTSFDDFIKLSRRKY